MIADTSFLVALFLQEDELHTKAELQFSTSKEDIMVLDRVLEETFTVLVYKRGINYALEVLEKINSNISFNIYRINELEWLSTMQLINKLKKRISFVDYFVIYFSTNNGNKILCFDEEILKILKNLS